MIEPRTDGCASGLLLEGVSQDSLKRLDFYEGGFGYSLIECEVLTEDGQQIAAQVYFPDAGSVVPGRDWSLDDWVSAWSQIALEAADELMSFYGQLSAEEAASRYPMMLLRAATRVRASLSPVPSQLRQVRGGGDLQTAATRRPYANYFTLEEHDIAFRRFSGDMSETVTRAAFVCGDAVTVLPYDPVRDRVMLIEQFRFAPHVRGDPLPWVLEPIAGRIDPGETPEDCARREGMEEARLTMGTLVPVANYYPSPGAVAEFLYSYIALCDLPDEAAGIGGLAEEAEDIRSHVIPFDQLMSLVQSGEAGCGPLVLSALWLAQNRDRLRSESPSAS